MQQHYEPQVRRPTPDDPLGVIENEIIIVETNQEGKQVVRGMTKTPTAIGDRRVTYTRRTFLISGAISTFGVYAASVGRALYHAGQALQDSRRTFSFPGRPGTSTLEMNQEFNDAYNEYNAISDRLHRAGRATDAMQYEIDEVMTDLGFDSVRKTKAYQAGLKPHTALKGWISKILGRTETPVDTEAFLERSKNAIELQRNFSETFDSLLRKLNENGKAPREREALMKEFVNAWELYTTFRQESKQYEAITTPYANRLRTQLKKETPTANHESDLYGKLFFATGGAAAVGLAHSYVFKPLANLLEPTIRKAVTPDITRREVLEKILKPYRTTRDNDAASTIRDEDVATEEPALETAPGDLDARVDTINEVKPNVEGS